MRQTEIKYFNEILHKIKNDLRYLRNKPKGVERQARHTAVLAHLASLQNNQAFAQLMSDNNFCLSALGKGLLDEPVDELDNFVSHCQNKLKQEPVQYKVVFFPYLASTWDSLESIYEAFAEDKRFITDIVIIPAYRVGTSERVSLYEDFLGKNNISHTHYTKYDIAIDKPDIVFVNNPYESATDPPFYNLRIKQNCGMLVYVPYYGIIAGTVGQKHTSFGQPIYNLADKIVVQSQLMAESCRQIFPAAKKNLFLPLGTPKIDAFKKKVVIATQNPKTDWAEKIAGRRVFLLDTHYNLPRWEKQLPNGERYNSLNFILGALLRFFRLRQDIFLIWRPHPMIEQVLVSYANAPWAKLMLGEMERLLQEAGQISNCILDREKDFSMAAAMSDAFISMGGSLRNIYLASGKPVIYHLYSEYNNLLLNEDEKAMIPNNELFYMPMSQKIFYFFRLRLYKGSPEADPELWVREENLLSGLNNKVRALYWQLVQKYAENNIFTPGFQQAIKNTSPHPVLGYVQHARRYARQTHQPALESHVLFDANSFSNELTKEHLAADLLLHIDRINAGLDIMKEKRLHCYSQTIANSDANCGAAVHDAVVENFLDTMRRPPMTMCTSNSSSANKKKKKNR